MSDQLTMFKAREFRAADASMFDRAVEGMIGLRCVLCKKGYRGMISLHFGQLQERPDPPPGAVGKKQGTWIIDMWDCDRRLTTGLTVIDSRTESERSFYEQLCSLEGEEIAGINLNDDLSSTIRFGSGAVLELMVEPDGSADAEQWAIELPERRAISVYGKAHWSVQSN